MKTMGRRFRAPVLIGAAASVLVFAGGASAQDHDNGTWPYAKTGRSPVLAVVGDIACQPDETTPAGEANHELCNNPKVPYTSNSLWQSQEATANQIEAMKPDLIALVGDLQYQVGQYTNFLQSFDLTYGAFKFLHRPSPGNHEFYDEHSQTGVAGRGYFSYYNGFKIDANGNPVMTVIQDPCLPINAAICNFPGLTAPVPQPVPRQDGQAGHVGDAGNGWYSYNLGSWHLISLNIECGTQPGGCDDTPGTWFASELEWLENDLAANHSQCTAAYWHQPTFSAANSISQEGVTAQAFWRLLYKYGADVVLNGHDHVYARYRPLDPSGNYDPTKGIREFIVGTGGETLDAIVLNAPAGTTPTSEPTKTVANFNAKNIEASSGQFWGVMGLTLNQTSYAWDFEPALQLPGVAVPPGAFNDTGVGTCHGPVNRGDNNNNQ